MLDKIYCDAVIEAFEKRIYAPCYCYINARDVLILEAYPDGQVFRFALPDVFMRIKYGLTAEMVAQSALMSYRTWIISSYIR